METTCVCVCVTASPQGPSECAVGLCGCCSLPLQLNDLLNLTVAIFNLKVSLCLLAVCGSHTELCQWAVIPSAEAA